MQVMASSRSHENALKGHTVNLAGGDNRQTRLHFQVLKCTHVYIALKELVDLFTGSQGGVSSVSPPNAKIALCVTDQKASFRDGKRMSYWGRCIGGGWVS